MSQNGIASTSSAAAEIAMSIARLTTLLKPCSGTSLMLMIGMPSRSSRRARSAITCSRSGTTLTSTHSRLDALEQLQHPDVLFGRQRDVEVIDAFARRDLAGLVERAEQRQAAVAEMVAAGAIVDEADDLVAELAVLEDLVGDQPAELAGAGDQDALQADARAPAPLEQLAHELARREREQHVDDEEERPDRAARPRTRRGPSLVGDASTPGRTAWRRCRRRRRGCCRRRRRRSRRRASGRAAAGRAPARGSANGTSTPMNGRTFDVLPERRVALGDGDQAGLEAEQVGEQERGHAEQRVGDDVEARRAGGCGALPPCPGRLGVSSMARRSRRAKRSRLNRSACRRMAAASNGRVGGLAQPRRQTPRRRASSTSTPVSPCDDRLERAAAAQRDHRPAAGLRLDRHDAEVFLAGQHDSGRAAGTARGSRRRYGVPRNSTGARRRASRRARRGRARRRRSQRHAGEAAGLDRDVDAFVGDQRGHDQHESLRARPSSGWKKSVSTGGYTTSPRDYSIGGSCPQHTENSPHSGPRARPSPRSQRASARHAPAASARLPSRPNRSGPK